MIFKQAITKTVWQPGKTGSTMTCGPGTGGGHDAFNGHGGERYRISPYPKVTGWRGVFSGFVQQTFKEPMTVGKDPHNLCGCVSQRDIPGIERMEMLPVYPERRIVLPAADRFNSGPARQALP